MKGRLTEQVEAALRSLLDEACARGTAEVRARAADPKAPGGVFIGVEEGGIYRSADGGETWRGLNEGL